MKIDINQDQYFEVEKLALGVFAPLDRFMHEDDFYSCVEKMRLSNGHVFTIPIFFDISETMEQEFKGVDKIALQFNGEHVANLFPDSFFRPKLEDICQKVFLTTESSHPGVHHYHSAGKVFVGGKVELIKRASFSFSASEYTPAQTKAYFKQMGWKKIVGFQTRNIPHRAHEYLQKAALEAVDGILIQPIVGKKKAGDFTAEAVVASYQALIDHYYPANRVKFATLSTVMRYAGPREAVFHALIRKNYGCTHFIIGRDHAGVGKYYDKYAGHQLAQLFENELGIEIFKFNGPYLCQKCDGIVTSKSCPHEVTSPNDCIEISGTLIRKLLLHEQDIDLRIIRPEVIASLKNLNIFI